MAAIGRSPNTNTCNLPFASRMFVDPSMNYATGRRRLAVRRSNRRSLLYRKEVCGLTADQLRAVRHERSRPIIEDREPWLRNQVRFDQSEDHTRQAIRYARPAASKQPWHNTPSYVRAVTSSKLVQASNTRVKSCPRPDAAIE